jgi:hypothetical protein
MTRSLPLLGVLLLAAACSTSSTDGDGGTSTSGGATTGGTGTGGTTTGTVTPVARLRVGALSPDTGAFDYCVSPNGMNTYVGPIMAARSQYGGLVYPSMSDYSSFPAGKYDIAFVTPGSLTCPLPDAGSSGVTTTTPDLAEGTSYTLALMGLQNALSFTYLTDDTSTTDPAIIRFISAKLGSASLDMTANSVTTFTDVAYNTVPTMPSNVDANGYAPLNSSGTFQLAFSVHGSSNPLLIAPGVTLTTNSYSSVFTIPPPSGYTGTLSAFVCFDSQQPVQGMANCLIYPLP